MTKSIANSLGHEINLLVGSQSSTHNKQGLCAGKKALRLFRGHVASDKKNEARALEQVALTMFLSREARYRVVEVIQKHCPKYDVVSAMKATHLPLAVSANEEAWTQAKVDVNALVTPLRALVFARLVVGVDSLMDVDMKIFEDLTFDTFRARSIELAKLCGGNENQDTFENAFFTPKVHLAATWDRRNHGSWLPAHKLIEAAE